MKSAIWPDGRALNSYQDVESFSAFTYLYKKRESKSVQDDTENVNESEERAFYGMKSGCAICILRFIQFFENHTEYLKFVGRVL